MSKLAKYYLFQCVVFLVLVIYNILFYSDYKADECQTQIVSGARILTNVLHNYRIIQTDNITTIDNNSTIETNNNTSDNTDTGFTTVTVTSSITLVTVPLVISIFYGIMIFLTLLSTFGIIQFREMPSERFGNLPWYWACCGFYVRNYAFLIKMISYITLFIIGIQAALIFFTSDCNDASHIVVNGTTTEDFKGAMAIKAKVVLIVDLGLWGFSHIVLPFIKKTLDQEAFLYEPLDSNTNVVFYILCNLLGP